MSYLPEEQEVNKQKEIIRDSSMGKGLVCAPNKMPNTPVHVVVDDTVTSQPQENQNVEHPKEVPLQWSEGA